LEHYVAGEERLLDRSPHMVMQAVANDREIGHRYDESFEVTYEGFARLDQGDPPAALECFARAPSLWRSTTPSGAAGWLRLGCATHLSTSDQPAAVSYPLYCHRAAALRRPYPSPWLSTSICLSAETALELPVP
jgi:hypothetical protein